MGAAHEGDGMREPIATYGAVEEVAHAIDVGPQRAGRRLRHGGRDKSRTQRTLVALHPMLRRAALVLVLVLALLVPRAPASPISRIVVLMMENHSFDNLLGWLPGVGDLTGKECVSFRFCVAQVCL